MTEDESTAWLGGWEGYRVETVERRSGERPEVWIYLGQRPGAPMVCDGCGEPVHRVHDIQRRVVRDLPILDATTWLSVPRRRVACPTCGPKLERLSWLDRHARVTRRLAASVVRLCAVLPIKQVAAFFDLHWETVKTLDKAALIGVGTPCRSTPSHRYPRMGYMRSGARRDRGGVSEPR